MRKIIFLLSVLLPAILLTTGCSIQVGNSKWDGSEEGSRQKHERQQREKISLLEVGETIDVIRADLGTPDFTEVYSKGSKKVKVLFYRTHRMKADGMTSKDECTALIFVENKLDSWGDRALAEL